MPMWKALGCLLIGAGAMSAQTAGKRPNRVQASAPNEVQSAEPALEPHALHVLKAMSRQLDAAHSFSFHARVMREEPATSGQMLEFFRDFRVEVKRPNKIRVTVKADNSESDLFYDGKTVTLLHPGKKLYTSLAAPPTIDATLQMLKDKLETHMYLTPFLVNATYPYLTDGLKTAHLVGFVDIGDARLLQTAFTEDGADWQLWVTGPKQILPSRLAIIYKNDPGAPRVNLNLSDWNLNAQIPESAFVFSKPAGAVAVSLEALRRKPASQAERKTHEKQ